ncbi:MAG: DUF2129 domain-containing protein [Paenibacillaceae bacterium]|jgi:uncharacterized protein YlbG (UPF0298 family)|nr:DUF2129 domain-containing protein [Paenibacillaceae bacterium]
MDDTQLIARSAWIVWVKNLHAVKQIEMIGEVYYVSKRLMYAVVYVNEADEQHARTRLQQLPFVRHVEPSFRSTFSEMVGNESMRGG